jgi:hypothetical protein
MLAGFLAALEGQVLDRKYHLRKLRGIGTFGAVFESDEVVANTVTRRRLAVKVMLSDASSSDRQLRELSLASRLDHHGIRGCLLKDRTLRPTAAQLRGMLRDASVPSPTW